MSVITIKNEEEIELMRHSGHVLAEAMDMMRTMVKPGVNVLDIDEAFAKFIKERGCTSNFLNYGGFPKHICVSINDQLVHGIPRDRKIQDGDVVSIDCGCIWKGYNSDAAFTMIAGTPKNEKDVILLKATEESLNRAIDIVKPGTRIGDIGATVQEYVESFGFSVPRDFTGHGIGTDMHEDPFIPNYGTRGTGMRLRAGMCICIEPMVQEGTMFTRTDPDGWTVYSVDHSNSAHFEQTILVTETGHEVLTRLKG